MNALIIKILIIYAAAGNPGTGIWENFNDLSHWQPMTFPKIKRRTLYSITRGRSLSYLTAETDNSASGIIYKNRFNVYKTPVIRWRWKISNVFSKGNGTVKSLDDYPVRVYILFRFDPAKAGAFERIKYHTARLIYGEYPPHSSVSYVWANREHNAVSITSPYSPRAIMVFKQKGGKNTGKWISEEANILEDYKSLFGENPPATAGLAIMSDSDNTGERGTAYIDYIRVTGK